MPRPQFISFEGIEGCGKSTQAKRLFDFFSSQKISAILTREPGGTPFGERIRDILIDEKSDKLNAKTETILNFAARLEHVEKVIKPSLVQNKIVISDRFFDSTYAYQGSAFGVEANFIEALKNMTIGDFEPDVTFLIDVPVEVAFERIKGREGNNRYEKLSFNFHQKVRDGFLKLAKKDPRIVLIDGMQDLDQVFNQITKTLKI